MSYQLLKTVDTKFILDIYHMIRSEDLELQPTFQRKFVWSLQHREQFIDTILKGYPFPEIYVGQYRLDLDKMVNKRMVVDGQQRITTLVRYIDGIDTFKYIPSFEQLSSEEKEAFLKYRVTFIDLGELDNERVKEIFQRINYTQYSLNKIEINNAIYDGAFIRTAKDLIDLITEKYNGGNLFTQVFSEFDLSRMADLHLMLMILATIENGGYFNSDKEVERYLVDFNDQYPQAQIVQEKVMTTIDYLEKLSLPSDTIWYRKSNFFTLLVELYKSGLGLNNFAQKLKDLENNILQNKDKGKDENDFAKYYHYMYTGTSNRQARVVRAEIFKKYTLN